MTGNFVGKFNNDILNTSALDNTVKSNDLNFENYFSPLQYLYIGYYVYNMMSVNELATHLSLPTDVVSNIISEIKLKPRILKGNDFEVGEALKDFAIRVESCK